MRDALKDTLRTVLSEMDGVPDDFEPELETPADPTHGDLSTNTALRLAGALKAPPRTIAEDLAARLREGVDPERIAAVEVAGPGFINFRFAEAHLSQGLASILDAGDAYGRTDGGAGQRVLVEYVSVNPTGPLTVGHGRNAVLGDTTANLYEWTGHDVEREYYFNDAGRQMRVLGQSVKARYEELLADEDMAPYFDFSAEEEQRWHAHCDAYDTKLIDAGDGQTVEVPKSFPEDGYLGEYVVDVARHLVETRGITLLDEEDVAPFKEVAEKMIFEQIEATLARLGIRMDRYFNEHTLYEKGEIEKTLSALREKEFVYEKEGATWLKTSRFGKTGEEGEPADTVLVKSTGEPTYRLPDIAYHADKFARGYDRMIDVFGADHIATYPDVLNALEVLGHDPQRVEVVIHQFVTLVRSGAPVKMSTRRATYVTLDDLMDEINAVLSEKALSEKTAERTEEAPDGEPHQDAGPDVVRFFFLMRSPNAHLEFDLDQATEASDKNPVFYLQYAHARICSIIDKAEETGAAFAEAPDFALLQHPSEEALIKELLRFPATLARAAEAKAPHRVANYLGDVATAFNGFYRDCRIIGEEEALATARMHLARAAQTVLRNGLTVLGLSAPRQM